MVIFTMLENKKLKWRNRMGKPNSHLMFRILGYVCAHDVEDDCG